MRAARRRAAVLAVVLAGLAGFARAQVPAPAPVQNLVQLSASATMDVPQDLLSFSLGTTREGSDAATVQGQLRQALDAALTEARKAAVPGQMDVRTGNFSLHPRYGRDGKLNGWQGSVEMVLEGRDFARISSTAGKIQTLTMGQVGFGLSREQRERVEGEVQAQAIERFKARAADIARGFGFGGYSLREVAVSTNEQGFMPRPKVMAMEARVAMADAPVPVEAGKSAVTVTVSGSVQLK
ncbi:MAG: SIMPL domain-containing protein [Rhodoferax sp.]|jgi:predicted secreted protein|nr:SIMPL domain-containing protein [Rhodoferax sp.]